MADDLFVMVAFAAAMVGMFQANRANEQVKKLQTQLAALRVELKLPPVDPDPRDANGWKIQ